jgi:hypothetical protein
MQIWVIDDELFGSHERVIVNPFICRAIERCWVPTKRKIAKTKGILGCLGDHWQMFHTIWQMSCLNPIVLFFEDIGEEVATTTPLVSQAKLEMDQFPYCEYRIHCLFSKDFQASDSQCNVYNILRNTL